MSEKKPLDTANEPVDTQDDEFMDTGVLHERNQVYTQCLDKSCELSHPHPPEEQK